VKAEIITIGTELLLGQIVDTNAAYLSAKLADTGFEPFFHTTVGDNRTRMTEVIKKALSRVDLVVTTGGIGPTEDDLTREIVADVVGKELEFQPHLMTQIENRFRLRGFNMAPNNRKQAFIPQGAIAIENPKGTAPGFIAEDSTGKVIVVLPGVPRELKFLMENTVLPFLVKRFDLGEQTIQYRVLRVCGLTESGVDRAIEDLMREGENPAIGLLASPGDIRIRIQARAKSLEDAEQLIAPVESEIRKRLGILIYGVDDETLEGAVRGLLEEKGKKLSIVDSFTGGTLAQRLLSAQSEKIAQCLVIAKESLLIRLNKRGFLREEGSMKSPEDQALSLASWTRDDSGADIGMAVLSEKSDVDEKKDTEKHLLVVGFSSKEGAKTYTYQIGGNRADNQHRAAILALDSLRKAALQGEVW
jgi:nicotinamide-nucleotide amidase